MSLQQPANILDTLTILANPRKRESACEQGFFRLPLEIRERIYFFALVSTRYFYGRSRTDVPFDWDPYARRYSKYQPEMLYWGTERMSCVLRINQQIYREAQHTLYGSGQFTFHWAYNACACSMLLFTSKRNDLAIGMIKTIGVSILIHMGTTLEDHQVRVQKQQALYEALLPKLVALRKVKMSITFMGGDIPSERIKIYSDALAGLTSIFRFVPCVEMNVNPNVKHRQRIDISRTAVENFRRKEWIELGSLEPQFECCTAERKAFLAETID